MCSCRLLSQVATGVLIHMAPDLAEAGALLQPGICSCIAQTHMLPHCHTVRAVLGGLSAADMPAASCTSTAAERMLKQKTVPAVRLLTAGTVFCPCLVNGLNTAVLVQSSLGSQTCLYNKPSSGCHSTGLAVIMQAPCSSHALPAHPDHKDVGSH